MFHLTDRTGTVLGKFSSIESAKASRPEVQEWRQDESRDLGWNGWIDPVPFSSHDYEITFMSSSRGGFTRLDKHAAIAVTVPGSGR